MPKNKSHGLYSCPTQILKCSSNLISGILSGGYSKYIYFNWSSSLLLTLKLKMAKIIPIFKQDDNTTLTIIGRSLCFLISTGSFIKYCLKELSLLLNRRICSLHPNMAFARHILLSMQPRYCECNTDKYEQPFILMWDFH